ncbi:MAG: cobalt-precorrin-6A reductase [Sporichthyaceae bacterium]
MSEPISAPLVLVLGGTGEARDLAALLVAQNRWRVLSSLAGRVSNPALPVGEVRLGGFGGPTALAHWLRTHQVRALVDATHPFAARISASAVAASAAAAVPLLVLQRPGWAPGPQDSWERVPVAAAAAAAIGTRSGPVLLTTGRGGLDAFADLRQRVVIRTVDPPVAPLPADHVVILDRGPYTVAGERALMLEHGIRTLVTKDSGGAMTAAKLTAARELGIHVWMIDRPAHPGHASGCTVSTPAAAFAWLDELANQVAASALVDFDGGDGGFAPATY